MPFIFDVRGRQIASLLALTAAAFLAPALRAGGIPALVLPAGVGVNIHFTSGHEKDLDLIAAAGFKWVREDFFWSAIERRRGEYDWSDYDNLVAQLKQRGLRAYFILDYSNPLYEEMVTGINPLNGKPEERTLASPQHPASVAAFARWAAAAAKHFRGRGVIWEIWNEPNIGFWKPKPDADQYAALALATCRAIRQADPQATIVAPASSGFPWAFLETLFKAGALQYLDAVSVHPYRPPKSPPESAAADYRRLRVLIEKYAPRGKKNLPIISGEWGYSSNTRGVSLEQQANFIARQQLSNLLNGVPVSIWYDWKNDGNDPAENEHNFGTVTADLTPKPAYTAIKILTHELAGGRLERRLDTGDTNDFVLVFRTGWHHGKLAAWTIGAAHQISLPLKKTSAKEFSFVNGVGQRGKIESENGRILIPLDGDPKYIDLNGGKISL
jgi:polysaccharide biosynthesis protein PslG